MKKYIMLCLAVFCLLEFANADPLKVTGETKLFKFNVEFKDSTMIEEYSDSLDLLQMRIKVVLNMVFSEAMIPEFYRFKIDMTNRHVIYEKIKTMERVIDGMPKGEKDRKKLIKARDALANIWLWLYAKYRFDWIDPKYKEGKK